MDTDDEADGQLVIDEQATDMSTGEGREQTAEGKQAVSEAAGPAPGDRPPSDAETTVTENGGRWETKANKRQGRSTARNATAPQLTAFVKGKFTNITKINPVRMQRIIRDAYGDGAKIYVAGRESLKVVCRDEAQLNIVKYTNKLDDKEVEVTDPVVGYKRQGETQAPDDTRKGVIVGVPDDVSNEELTSETKAQRAIRLTKADGPRRVQTSAVLLIFAGQKLPETVTLGYRRYKVRQYNPPPTRCFKCQAYGHTSKFCRSSATCPRCGGRHDYEQCRTKTGEPKCANCKQAHSTAYKGCPAYKRAVRITQKAASEGMTYAEAAKRVPVAVRPATADNGAAAKVSGGDKPAPGTTGGGNVHAESKAGVRSVSSVPVSLNANNVNINRQPIVNRKSTQPTTEDAAGGEESDAAVDMSLTQLPTVSGAQPVPQTPIRRAKRKVQGSGEKSGRTTKAPRTTRHRGDTSYSDDEPPSVDNFHHGPTTKPTTTVNTEMLNKQVVCEFLSMLISAIKEGADTEQLYNTVVKEAEKLLELTVHDIDWSDQRKASATGGQ